MDTCLPAWQRNGSHFASAVAIKRIGADGSQKSRKEINMVKSNSVKMRKAHLRYSLIFCLVFLSTVWLTAQESRWTEAQANAWYAQQPWPVGANLLPSTNWKCGRPTLSIQSRLTANWGGQKASA